MLPPPRSTLFPYTTLFRSAVLIIDEAQNLTFPVLEEIRLLTNLETSTDKLLQIDRKSTRLNSSHRCISYAVFCLKKKKTFQFCWFYGYPHAGRSKCRGRVI